MILRKPEKKRRFFAKILYFTKYRRCFLQHFWKWVGGAYVAPLQELFTFHVCGICSTVSFVWFGFWVLCLYYFLLKVFILMHRDISSIWEMVQMFLYVDLMIACRISLEIKQCLKRSARSCCLTQTVSPRDNLPSQSLPAPQSQMFTSPAGSSRNTNKTKPLQKKQTTYDCKNRNRLEFSFKYHIIRHSCPQPKTWSKINIHKKHVKAWTS